MMERETGLDWRFGGSLRCERAQAVAARCGEVVPERYLRPELDGDPAIASGDDVSIPTIDFGKLLDPDFSEAEAAKYHSACADWGFFQLINHDIPEEIINEFKYSIKEFFSLPSEEKKKVAQLPKGIEGYGNAFIQSEEQKLDWGDMLFLTTLPDHKRTMGLWPTDPPSFREAMNKYSSQVKRIASQLLRIMSKNLRLQSDKFINIFEGGRQYMRINYYPPCLNPEKVLGLSPHSDAVGLTLLLQINEVQGLQIKRNGGWLTVKPFPGAFIVNIGDIIEILCNGLYKSIEHRAVVSENKERLSIAAFHTLNIGDTVSPLSETVNEDHIHYKSLDFEDFMVQLFSNKLDGKNMLEFMKL